jgi:(p)ppGpp synthase/HD superfamily hydrolase
MMTIEGAIEIARDAHAGQVDKGGFPYIDHVVSVGRGLADFDQDVQIAGILHDVIEDTDHDAESLRALGVSERSIEIVVAVSRNMQPARATYMDMIRSLTDDVSAALVKIADNAHNSLESRKTDLPEGAASFQRRRYRKARAVLYDAVDAADIKAILKRINPALLAEYFSEEN